MTFHQALNRYRDRGGRVGPGTTIAPRRFLDPTSHVSTKSHRRISAARPAGRRAPSIAHKDFARAPTQADHRCGPTRTGPPTPIPGPHLPFRPPFPVSLTGVLIVPTRMTSRREAECTPRP